MTVFCLHSSAQPRCPGPSVLQPSHLGWHLLASSPPGSPPQSPSPLSCYHSSRTPCPFFPKLVLGKISLYSTPQSSLGLFLESFVPPVPQLIQVSRLGLYAPPPPLLRRPDLLRVFCGAALPPSRCAPPYARLPGSRLQGYPATSPGSASSSRLPFLSCACGEGGRGLGPPGEIVSPASLVLSVLVHPFVSLACLPFPCPVSFPFSPAL